MAMAWRDQVDDNLSYKERLALIKDKAKGLGDPARSAFLWMPDDTEVHKADISYWVPHAWNNHQGRLTLIGDAAHPMPPCKSFLIYFRRYLSVLCFQHALFKEYRLMQPYVNTDRGQGLNHCIRDVAYLLEAMQDWSDSKQTLQEAIQKFESEMIARGQEEVTCSVENGYMLHDWNKVQQSPVFNRGFKPMDGHSNTNKVGNAINA